MSTWTFTTTDLREAAAISLLCVTQGLHGVTETKQDTPNKPVLVQTRRKAAPIDHGCWHDPEARKVRAKAQAWGRRPTQGVMPDVARTRDATQDYADAMGWTKEEAAAKIKAHQAHLDANTPEYRW